MLDHLRFSKIAIFGLLALAGTLSAEAGIAQARRSTGTERKPEDRKVENRTNSSPAGEPRKVALLAGINEYQKPGFSTLDYAERDVEDLGAELQKHGFEVVILKGSASGSQKATRANILSRLKELLRPIGKEDIALVSFSGHGQQLRITTPDGEKKEDGFFCPVDGIIGDAESLISISHVTDDILAKNGGRNLLLIDACRDVADANRRKTRGIQGKVVALPEDTTVLFSCRAGQRSIESPALQHGVFTYCVLEGLRGGAAQEGEVNWDTLVGYVKRQMSSRQIRDVIGDEIQVPISAGGVQHTVLARVASTSPRTQPKRPAPAIEPDAGLERIETTDELPPPSAPGVEYEETTQANPGLAGPGLDRDTPRGGSDRGEGIIYDEPPPPSPAPEPESEGTLEEPAPGMESEENHELPPPAPPGVVPDN